MQVFEGKNGTHIQFNFGKEEAKVPAAKPAKVHFSSKTSETSSTRPKAEGTKKRVRTQQGFDGSPAKSIKAKADALAASARSTATKPSIKTIKSRLAKNGRLSSSPFDTDRSPPTALRRQRVERAPTKITMMHEVGKLDRRPGATGDV
jgi:abnormal spindle-like microcephaly-associated protein